MIRLGEGAPVTSPRIARLRELFKQETSVILRREMKDPRVGFVSVTDVELSPDLSHARIFVSIQRPDPSREMSAPSWPTGSGCATSPK